MSLVSRSESREQEVTEDLGAQVESTRNVEAALPLASLQLQQHLTFQIETHE